MELTKRILNGIKDTAVSVIKNPIVRGTTYLAFLGVLNGCKESYPQYIFDGKIGEDQVSFEETRNTCMDKLILLSVGKPDGRIIIYRDVKGDLEIEYVDIKQQGITTEYSKYDETEKPILEEAQRQFNVYLASIDSIKTINRQKSQEDKVKEALENLK